MQHHSPSLHLKGHWLAEAEFESVCLAKVTIEQGRITMYPAT
ncbi:type I toxin-antitoxin system SymE family toxin [Jejubacter calystegiae]|uniref:Type I toxin-antitoxin system SymE family toxin n=1 Tax=Jejubacter calystegiae TaxID=2579935 RepID=A0A4P8YP61_9ENTR|nr:type I toxin-antitoxin system SymE family toxin [Jejubacter calystegiae]